MDLIAILNANGDFRKGELMLPPFLYSLAYRRFFIGLSYDYRFPTRLVNDLHFFSVSGTIG